MQHDASPQPPTRARLVTPVFLLITSSSFLYFIAIGALFPVLPRYVRGPLGGGNVAVGLAVGAFSLSAVVLRPLVGRLGDARGRRLLIVGGAAIIAASIALYTAADALWILFVLRLASGAGEAAFFVGAATAINDIAPAERRGEAVSFFSLALYGGVAVGPLIGESVLHGTRYSVVWVLAAALGAGAALLGAGVPDTRPPREETDATSTKFLHRAALRPGLVLAASQWGFAAFSSFVALFALQLGLGGARFVFFAYASTVFVIRGLGARIPDALGPVRTASISLVTSMTGLLAMGLARRPGVLYASTVVFAAGQALAFPALMSLAVSAAPDRERGAVVGTFTAFFDVSYSLGPISLGAVAAAFDYRGAFIAAAVVHVIGLGILLSQYRGRR